AGLVADGDADEGRRFPIPPTPFPSVRSTASALLNQNTLRELADALKCLDPAEHGVRPLRALVRTLRQTRMRSVDGVTTTLFALLAVDSGRLGNLTVAEAHHEVLDPDLAPTADASPDASREVRVDRPRGDKARVECG